MMRPSTSSNGGGAKFPLESTATTLTCGSSDFGIINPVFVDHQPSTTKVESLEKEADEEFPPPPPPQTFNNRKVETVDRTDSASYVSSAASTVVTNASVGSAGGLLIESNSDPFSRLDNCVDCLQFHQNQHRVLTNHKRRVYLPDTTSIHQPSSILPYAPYPPQWYYLLAADSKQFRKHRHTHYRRDCRQCREIVRCTFEQYYLRSGQFHPPHTKSQPPVPSTATGSNSHSIANSPDTGETTDSIGSVSLDHNQPNLHRRRTSPPYSIMPTAISPSLMTKSVSPGLSLYKPRASCGHSCLKFSILFYCCVAVIMAISFICYLTRMFGLMSDSSSPAYSDNFPSQMIGNYEISPFNNSIDAINDDFGNFNGSQSNSTFSFDLMGNDMDDSGQQQQQFHTTTLWERLRAQIIGLLVASALVLIFILGLVGAFLESVLCLRIFGAILSYLFLLTFGSALYIVILLVISNAALKLVLSTISCAAVAITIHGLLAIAPFAFADLISEERKDEITEAANSTYFKYPSVRFLPFMPPIKPSGGSYFGLRSNSTVAPFPQILATNEQQPPSSFFRDTPIESIPTSEEWFPGATPTSNQQEIPLDNISSQELIPSASQSQNENGSNTKLKSNPQTVRFLDNWM